LLVPAGEESTAEGEVKVGPTVRVQLIGDDNDVAITPRDEIISGTGSNVAIEFTWYVWPKHPAKALRLTAHMEVPLPTGGPWTTDLPLTRQVPNRPGYIAYSFFHNVAAWVSLSGVVTALLLWLGAHWTRRRQGSQTVDTPVMPAYQDSGGEDQLVTLDKILVDGRPVTVSTMNVVIDLREGAKPTLRFETVMSGQGLDDLSWRYSSEDAARAGHARVVTALRTGQPLPGHCSSA
jgi:hypothetical protein